MRDFFNLFTLEKKYKEYDYLLIGHTKIFIITLCKNDNKYKLIMPFITLSYYYNMYITIISSIEELYLLDEVIDLFEFIICFVW